MTVCKTQIKKKCAKMKLCYGKPAFFAKPTSELKNEDFDKKIKAATKQQFVAIFCVLATFMTRRKSLPGKIAFSESIKLGRRLRKTCDSYVNFSSLVEKSELGTYVRVSRIVDVCEEYSRSRQNVQETKIRNRDHSFLTHMEATALLDNFPTGTVGMSINTMGVHVFFRKGKVYDSITATYEGNWLVSAAHDKLCVLPQANDSTELLIFEPLI